MNWYYIPGQYSTLNYTTISELMNNTNAERARRGLAAHDFNNITQHSYSNNDTMQRIANAINAITTETIGDLSYSLSPPAATNIITTGFYYDCKNALDNLCLRTKQPVYDWNPTCNWTFDDIEGHSHIGAFRVYNQQAYRSSFFYGDGNRPCAVGNWVLVYPDDVFIGWNKVPATTPNGYNANIKFFPNDMYWNTVWQANTETLYDTRGGMYGYAIRSATKYVKAYTWTL